MILIPRKRKNGFGQFGAFGSEYMTEVDVQAARDVDTRDVFLQSGGSISPSGGWVYPDTSRPDARNGVVTTPSGGVVYPEHGIVGGLSAPGQGGKFSVAPVAPVAPVDPTAEDAAMAETGLYLLYGILAVVVVGAGAYFLGSSKS